MLIFRINIKEFPLSQQTGLIKISNIDTTENDLKYAELSETLTTLKTRTDYYKKKHDSLIKEKKDTLYTLAVVTNANSVLKTSLESVLEKLELIKKTSSNISAELSLRIYANILFRYYIMKSVLEHIDKI